MALSRVICVKLVNLDSQEKMLLSCLVSQAADAAGPG